VIFFFCKKIKFKNSSKFQNLKKIFLYRKNYKSIAEGTILKFKVQIKERKKILEIIKKQIFIEK